MAVLNVLFQFGWQNLFLLPLSFLLLRSLYRVYFHPLRAVPGPVFARLSSIWLSYHGYVGDECATIRRLHLQYGPVVRISSNDVDIANGDALWPIYIDKGGFQKADYYKTFDLGEHATIFSSINSENRDQQVKAVNPIFSMANIRGASSLIANCSEKFVARLQQAAGSGRPVNLIPLTRAFALDAVSSYVFCSNYESLEEEPGQLSAGDCVDTFISDSRWYYLPHLITQLAQRYVPQILPNPKAVSSEQIVDQYLNSIITRAKDGKCDSSYQACLLKRQIKESEVFSQCKDALFAGTDSTGNTLAQLIWYLVRNPDKYEKLRDEVHSNTDGETEVVNLPYLNGVVKEALRLTMTISIRFPRVVPVSGWIFDGWHFPAGTVVGVSGYQLHLNEEIFPEPHAFKPERWLEATSEMQRDHLPFGKGARSCIARNLAMSELCLVTEKLVQADLLRQATSNQESVEKYEWFFSRIKGDSIEVTWPVENGDALKA